MAEVELKFELPPQSEAALRAHPDLAHVRPVTRRLLALYFDTPGQEVAGHEMALRLRRSGRGWMQCLKAGRSGSGGLHARDEWEYAQRGPCLDLALFADTPLAKLPDASHLHERLEEIFRVDMRRTTWQVELAPGQRVEVALDRGEVRRDGAAEPVHEVEIESLEGSPLALFDLAQRLTATVPMRPSTVTKARRGYRLLRGETLAPVAARAASLDPTASPCDAACSAIALALDQLQANGEGVAASDNPEYVHQMRSALRRIRSGLRVFRKAIGSDLEDQVRDEIRWLGAVLGEARDWDVLATETLPPILQARGAAPADGDLVAAIAERRRAKRQALCDALESTRYTRFVLALARWLAQSSQAGPGSGDLRMLAGRTLRTRLRKFIDASRNLSHQDAGERHGIRIEAKRLRYAVDALAALYPPKRVKEFVRSLGKVQDALGKANDAAVAARLLASLGATPELTEFARGWLGARAVMSVADFERRVARIETATPFWRKD